MAQRDIKQLIRYRRTDISKGNATRRVQSLPGLLTFSSHGISWFCSGIVDKMFASNYSLSFVFLPFADCFLRSFIFSLWSWLGSLLGLLRDPEHNHSNTQRSVTLTILTVRHTSLQSTSTPPTTTTITNYFGCMATSSHGNHSNKGVWGEYQCLMGRLEKAANEALQLCIQCLEISNVLNDY